MKDQTLLTISSNKEDLLVTVHRTIAMPLSVVGEAEVEATIIKTVMERLAYIFRKEGPSEIARELRYLGTVRPPKEERGNTTMQDLFPQ